MTLVDYYVHHGTTVDCSQVPWLQFHHLIFKTLASWKKLNFSAL